MKIKIPSGEAEMEGYLKQRNADGALNMRKLLRELKGDTGGLTYVILYVQPYRAT